MSRDSWDAALAAAGVAIGAVEQGIERGSAFGATRRPGTTPSAAEPWDSAAQQCRGGGTTRAAAGEGARADRGLDVHHGNGTQALVERDPRSATCRCTSTPGIRDRRRGRARRRNVFNVPRPPGLPARCTCGTCSRPSTPPWSGGGRTSCWSPPVSTRSRAIRWVGSRSSRDVAHWTSAFRARLAPAPVVGVLEGGTGSTCSPRARARRARACLMVPTSDTTVVTATAARRHPNIGRPASIGGPTGSRARPAPPAARHRACGRRRAVGGRRQ